MNETTRIWIETNKRDWLGRQPKSPQTGRRRTAVAAYETTAASAAVVRGARIASERQKAAKAPATGAALRARLDRVKSSLDATVPRPPRRLKSGDQLRDELLSRARREAAAIRGDVGPARGVDVVWRHAGDPFATIAQDGAR
jgi:hypothetical protein